MSRNNNDRIDTKEEYALMRRARSFVYAFRGILIFVRTTPNVWVELLVFVATLSMGTFFQITKTEWLFILLASALVITTEAINTALEVDINLTSPTYHPYARDVKDIAAGAVLIASLFALIIGLLIFVPYLLNALI